MKLHAWKYSCRFFCNKEGNLDIQIESRTKEIDRRCINNFSAATPTDTQLNIQDCATDFRKIPQDFSSFFHERVL